MDKPLVPKLNLMSNFWAFIELNVNNWCSATHYLGTSGINDFKFTDILNLAVIVLLQSYTKQRGCSEVCFNSLLHKTFSVIIKLIEPLYTDKF